MEKYIIRLTYWAGILFLGMAFLLRSINALGLEAHLPSKGSLIGYNSFMDGATIMFIASIATAAYTWITSNSK